MKHRFAWGFQWPWQFGFFSEYYDGPIWALHLGPIWFNWADYPRF